jgi:hypothetical protein
LSPGLLQKQLCEVSVLANDCVQAVSHQSIAVRHPGDGVPRFTIVELVIEDGKCAWVWQNMNETRYKDNLKQKCLKEFKLGTRKFSIHDLKERCDACSIIGQEYSATSCNCQEFVGQMTIGLGFDVNSLPSSTTTFLVTLGVITTVGGGVALAVFCPQSMIAFGYRICGQLMIQGISEIAVVEYAVGTATATAGAGIAGAVLEKKAIDQFHHSSLQ